MFQRIRQTLYTTLLLSTLCYNTAWAEEELLCRTIAIVNRDIITEIDLVYGSQEAAGLLAARGVQVDSIESLYPQVLSQLILKKAQEDLADQLGIRIRDDEVNEQITLIAQENNMDLMTFRRALEAQETGSFIRLRDNVRSELTLEVLRNQEVAQRIYVSPEEVKNFIARKLGKASSNTRYALQHILIPVPDAATPAQIQAAQAKINGIHQRLLSGEDFASLAVSYSGDSKALSGGDLGWLSASELPDFLESAVTSMSISDISAPIQSGLGFHLIKLNAIESYQQDADIPKDLEDQAFRILRQQKGSNLYEQWLRRVYDEAYVNILVPEYKRDNHFE